MSRWEERWVMPFDLRSNHHTSLDRGTWVKLKTEMADNLKLKILFEKDQALINPYGIILLNPQKYPNVNSRVAEKFFLFMVSDEGQRLIGRFEFGGEQLFFPIFGKPELIGLPSEKDEVQYWVQKLRENEMEPPSWVPSVIGITALLPTNTEAHEGESYAWLGRGLFTESLEPYSWYSPATQRFSG